MEHGIRGKESLEDGRFVEDLCKKLGVPFEMKSVDVPVFADINFDDDNTPAGAGETVEESPIDKVLNFLRGAGVDANVAGGDLIVANGCAIAVHDDDDFWVPDEIDWFAAGKQRAGWLENTE